MKITDIFDRILLRSGQFIIKRGNIDIDVDSFRILVEDALSDYSGAVPYSCDYDMNFNSTRSFKFPDDFDSELNRSPDWISEVTPISSHGSIYSVLNQGLTATSRTAYSELIEPIQAPWDYNKKTKVLTVPYSAYYKVTGVYNHEIISEIIDGVEVYSIPTISREDQPFFDLLRAMFLIGIGRSRRAFTLNDLPITMDADQLASEGEALLEKATEALQNDQKFYLAFR